MGLRGELFCIIRYIKLSPYSHFSDTGSMKELSVIFNEIVLLGESYSSLSIAGHFDHYLEGAKVLSCCLVCYVGKSTFSKSLFLPSRSRWLYIESMSLLRPEKPSTSVAGLGNATSPCTSFKPKRYTSE